MRVLWLQFLSEVKLFFRYKVSVFWTFFFPLFFMVLFALLNFGGETPIPMINYLHKLCTLNILSTRKTASS